jgi:2'-5' RNA ligase
MSERRLRCFIACFLCPASAQKLAAAVPDVPGCRRVPAANLHLTLHFVGAVEPGRAEDVVALAAALDGEPSRASVLEIVGLPRRGRPRSVVGVLEVDPVLSRWRDVLLERWPTGERRGFLPHVTLLRSKRRIRVPPMPDLAGEPIDLLPPAAYVSETLPEGAHYELLG